jgi:hypothetical protein
VERSIKPFPPTGARTLDSRTSFYYAYTMDSPGMIMRLPNVGSQYLMGFTDSKKNPFDGAKTYRVTLPKGIPAAKFWSFTVYDNQTRSMLQTPQRSRVREAGRSRRRRRCECGRLDDGCFGPSSRPMRKRAAGFRRRPAKAGSRSCASTARRGRSSTKLASSEIEEVK